jgi:Ca-activated chloride channel family protein
MLRLLFLAGAVTAAGLTPAAEQQPVFRTGVETVAIYASVLDRYGEMAFGLDRDDFKVFDNGKVQKLTTFVVGLQPITAILLVDTSASMTASLDLAREAAEQFVIRLMPGDKVRVGSFSDRIDIHPEFTGDRDELLRALRNGLDIGNPTMLWDAVGEAMDQLTPLGGRRIVMVFTDGLDTLSRQTPSKILQRTREDELMVYVVQFRSAPLGSLAELQSPQVASSWSGGSGRPVPPAKVLQQIAAETGGGHFFLGQYDNVNATFTRVAQELHYQYVLGFTPQISDGKVHRLTVEVDRPEMTVRARQYYRAPEPRR